MAQTDSTVGEDEPTVAGQGPSRSRGSSLLRASGRTWLLSSRRRTEKGAEGYSEAVPLSERVPVERRRGHGRLRSADKITVEGV